MAWFKGSGLISTPSYVISDNRTLCSEWKRKQWVADTQVLRHIASKLSMLLASPVQTLACTEINNWLYHKLEMMLFVTINTVLDLVNRFLTIGGFPLSSPEGKTEHGVSQIIKIIRLLFSSCPGFLVKLCFLI